MAKRTLLALVSLAALAAAIGFCLWKAHWGTRPGLAASSYVPIQDGKTIDFSTGRPVVRETASDQAAIDNALKEMNAAAKDVVFEPTASPKSPKN